MVKIIRKVCILSSLVAFIAGCGYNTQSLIATEFKSIYVEPFANKINITAEQSNARMYRGYRPGLEIEITKKVIDRYMSDGNLKIGSSDNADVILKSELTDYRKEPLRYDSNDNIEEYRIKIIVNIQLVDADTGKTIWKEMGFSGETTYRTNGSLAKSESQAIREAMDDLARRIVERTVEGW